LLSTDVRFFSLERFLAFLGLGCWTKGCSPSEVSVLGAAVAVPGVFRGGGRLLPVVETPEVGEITPEVDPPEVGALTPEVDFNTRRNSLCDSATEGMYCVGAEVVAGAFVEGVV
jgi:hypothetical protein